MRKQAGVILKGQGGFAFIVMVLLVLGLGTMGLALAAGTVSNYKNHMAYENLEQDYFSVDGAMNHVQAILERAAAAGRDHAQKAADAAYESGLASGVPPTSDALDEIYRTAFEAYIRNGAGKNYITQQLAKLESDTRFHVKPVVDWSSISVDSEGLRIEVENKKNQRAQKLEAAFRIPYNYAQAEDREYAPSAPPVELPIGHYNPLFRSALTMNADIRVDGDLTVRSNTPNGIALQWTDTMSLSMLSFEKTLHLYGTTLPVIQMSYPRTIKTTYQDIKVNGISTKRTPKYHGVKPISLTDYYNKSHMANIYKNDKSRSWDSSPNIFVAEEDGYVLHIYPGSTSDNHNWSRYSGKKGLVIFENAFSSYTTYGSLIKFQGALLILGDKNAGAGDYNHTSTTGGLPMDLTYDPEAVERAIALYRKVAPAGKKDVLEKMFKLDTLMNNPTQPESYTRKYITSSPVLKEPVTISNQRVTKTGITKAATPADFYINNRKIYLYSDNEATKGFQSPEGTMKAKTEWVGSGIYWRSKQILGNDKDTTLSIGNSGNIFSYISADVIQAMLKENVPYAVAEEGAADGNYFLLVHNGDLKIEYGNVGYVDGQYHKNGQQTPREWISGKKGFIFINGKLTIEQGLDFTGAIIATDGIYAIHSGDIKISHDPQAALHAINLSEEAVKLFDMPANGTREATFSIYDTDGGSGSSGGSGGGSSGSGSGGSGADGSGNIVYNPRGVTVESWRTTQ